MVVYISGFIAVSKICYCFKSSSVGSPLLLGLEPLALANAEVLVVLLFIFLLADLNSLPLSFTSEGSASTKSEMADFVGDLAAYAYN